MCRSTKAFAVVLLGSFLLAGCGQSSDGLHAVSGNVSLKGKPLEHGVISFEPTSKDIKTFAGATIEQGTFSIPANKGLMSGVYRVRISSGDPSTPVPEDEIPGESGPPAKELVPAEYNINTKEKFEVKAGQVNVYNVDIP